MRESTREQKADSGHLRVGQHRSGQSPHASLVPDAASAAILANPARLPEALSQLSHPGAGSLRVQLLRSLQRTYGNQVVMRMVRAANSAVLQKKCAPCASGKGLCPKCAEEEGLSLQRRSTNQAEPSKIPPIVHEVLRSSGQAMDADARAVMESRFAHDFSQVRVHTDAKAAESAQAVNALAYTVGHNMVFGAGQYAPGGSEGRGLLAHELTHVVQQGSGAAYGATLISLPTDEQEREADRVARTVGNENSRLSRMVLPNLITLRSAARLQRLGANPGCTDPERRALHQAIFDARGWLNKAIPKLEALPLAAAVLGSLRRNFGSTYGVAANANLIASRLRVARRTLGTIPFSCDTPGTTPLCAANHCGWAVPGSGAATICTNPPSTLDLGSAFRAGCVLHESLHAAFSFMTVDRYSGTAGYPGPGTDPLLNPDSYTQLTRDLS